MVVNIKPGERVSVKGPDYFEKGMVISIDDEFITFQFDGAGRTTTFTNEQFLKFEVWDEEEMLR